MKVPPVVFPESAGINRRSFFSGAAALAFNLIGERIGLAAGPLDGFLPAPGEFLSAMKALLDAHGIPNDRFTEKNVFPNPLRRSVPQPRPSKRAVDVPWTSPDSIHSQLGPEYLISGFRLFPRRTGPDGETVIEIERGQLFLDGYDAARNGKPLPSKGISMPEAEQCADPSERIGGSLPHLCGPRLPMNEEDMEPLIRLFDVYFVRGTNRKLDPRHWVVAYKRHVNLKGRLVWAYGVFRLPERWTGEYSENARFLISSPGLTS